MPSLRWRARIGRRGCSYRTERMLVSDGADARAFRHESPKVVSALAGMVINSAEMVINSAEVVTRLTKVICSIAKTIDLLRCAIEVLRIAIGVLRCGHPLGCEELWENREEDKGMGAAYCGAWERKKRVDIAGWLCLHASIIDHADGGMLFTSLLHPSRCKPTCSTRLHERSRHQKR